MSTDHVTINKLEFEYCFKHDSVRDITNPYVKFSDGLMGDINAGNLHITPRSIDMLEALRNKGVVVTFKHFR